MCRKGLSSQNCEAKNSNTAKVHVPLGEAAGSQCEPRVGKCDGGGGGVLLRRWVGRYFRIMDNLKGVRALEWARELSKVPEGCFKIAFFPYNRKTGKVGTTLRVLEGCKVRRALPEEAFSVASENYFLFKDKDGNNKMCYKILIRYMGFPHDNFTLRKIDWL